MSLLPLRFQSLRYTLRSPRISAPGAIRCRRRSSTSADSFRRKFSHSVWNESSVDVLVVGAGPTGLQTALALARAGIKVKIVDKRPSNVIAGHGDGIQPRTIEVMQSYGLAHRLLAEGNQMRIAAFYNPGANGGIERTARAPDVNAPTARYPFKITLHQGAIEQIYIDSLNEMKVPVHRPLTPVYIDMPDGDHDDPNAYPVMIALQRLDKEDDFELVRAKYVVGADGAHSWIRKQLGITMDGEHTEYVWGVVDTYPMTDFPDIRNRTAIHSNYGSCMVIPREGDKVRLYIQLAEVEVGQAGRLDRSKMMGPEKLLEVAQKCFQPYSITFPPNIEWWTHYVIGQRVASHFGKGRIFIAGDACHTHSPKAGQGMNAGLNDGHNLAWKLAHVIRGWAHPSLLNTYEAERRTYAQQLIDFDKRFAALFSGKPRTLENLTGVTHEEFLSAHQTFGGFTSGIGVHYPESAIVNSSFQDVATKLAIGQRFLPHMVTRIADSRPFELQDLLPSDGRFKILVFLGDTSHEDQRLRLTTLAQELDDPSAFLKLYAPSEGPANQVFDLISITSNETSLSDLPKPLRPHWSKVFADIYPTPEQGERAYEAYGISRTYGGIVVVRPDGYVGMVAPLDGVRQLDDYFSGFMVHG